MRKIYTAITMLLFSVSVFALETELISAAAEQATPTDFVTFTVAGEVEAAAIDADAKTVVVKLPAGTEVTALTPEFTLSEGASAYIGQVTSTTLQVSGESVVDFTDAVVYTIFNDGAQSDWTVSVDLVDAIETNIFSEAKVYPNPATDRLVVENIAGAEKAIIANVVGQTVRVEAITAATATINLADLNKGIYVITIVGGNEKFTARFIKE